MPSDSTLYHKRLLVVDDHPVNVELLQDLLEDHGYRQVAGLTDPREVLAHCQAQVPDLLLLDIRMPHMDGYAVLEALQQAFAMEAPPTIVLTAQVDDDTRRQALAMGVRDFLTKPFDHEEVLARIHNALRDQSHYQWRRDQAAMLERLVAQRTRELERLSCTDPVTNLPNRRGLTATLGEWQRDGVVVGALFIVLQGIDAIMRYHGHRMTEVLLSEMARRLKATLPDQGVVGIWGSHELLLIQPRASMAELEHLAARVRGELKRPLATSGVRLQIDGRIGVAGGVSLEPERLVHMAALAVPHAREGVAIQVHSSALEASEQRRMQLRQALPQAVQRGETSLHYQAKVALASGRTCGAEVLVRWTHPALGMVSPAEFIPMAEASGDILALGAWVLEAALATLSRWRREGLVDEAFSLAVNVSAHQLCRPGFVAEVHEALARYDVPPSALEVEVTESAVMTDLEVATLQLQQLADLGVSIAIDDFGTGHSSLAYLRRMPVDTIKIDRSFLTHLLDDAQSHRLVESIVAMAHGLDCRVVAEGIEAPAQAASLAAMGCEMGQGFWFARPQPVESFLPLLEEYR
ncbi:EAL domain-containing protein [Halomonas saccharevitans]|uniref:EAL domain-containing protein n=1 Tax=Halomonas saccharevitans TaxID=416872 RepID=A0ABU3NA57_9GAMM|nr:EAL domain-containing protein [Halomonas saccharevitans]MDT8878065.1 EAL domain-containing protein [Halomonas saccharevitans]